VGAHQLFPGYCVLVSKEHVREPFDLEAGVQAKMFAELMRSAQAIQNAFNPWKMNYGCYGNVVPHVHWHLFPRYESDPMLKLTPWMQSAEFDKHRTTEAQAREVAARICAAL
jgi:diadenosine tetraphosphate (Ap4A) HIT family hydrolase